MTQKVPLRNPFGGIDFTGQNNQVIDFSNDAPSFPVELPKGKTDFTKNQSPIINNPFPISAPEKSQELSGNISLTGGYPLFNSKRDSISDILDEPPLLEGKCSEKLTKFSYFLRFGN